MISGDKKKEFCQALLERNAAYEGLFFAGVTSTGVFCRPTCPARKPKYENCEFFLTPQEALLASFRPCKRCTPLSHPDQVSELVQKLVQAVEENPEKKWREKDFRELSIDESTARRQFKKRFGMTFVQYARARRMGLAMKEIRSGKSVIDAQLNSGYESSSGFRDAFSRIMGESPASAQENQLLKASWVDTRMGPMIAVADETHLYLLEFVDRRGLEKEVEVLRRKKKAAIIPGKTPPMQTIEEELHLYFFWEFNQIHNTCGIHRHSFSYEGMGRTKGNSCRGNPHICRDCPCHWETCGCPCRCWSERG